MANTTDTPRVVITNETVSAFVDTFGTGDSMTVARVKAVALALHGNSVGEKGSPSQNAVLRQLSEAIQHKLGESASVRHGWKFANLGNYARVVRAIDTLGLSIEKQAVVVALYGVQNNARDAFGPMLEEFAGKGTPSAREKAVLAKAAEIFSDLAKARSAALADAKAKKGDTARKAAAKGEGEGAVTVANILAAPQTTAVFLQSLTEALDSQAEWSAEQWAEIAEGLIERGDAIVNRLEAEKEAAQEKVSTK